MSIEKAVQAIAGIFVFASATLAYYHSIDWLFFTAFVGLNLFQSAFTGFCPLANILKMFGLKSEKAAA